MEDIAKFFNDYGNALTAFAAWIALFQPLCIYLGNRFFKSGHIDIYETSTIEIGYSSYGPTIGLGGTMKVSHRDVFIPRIRLTLVKEKDHSQHGFEWCLFRSLKMTVGKGQEIALELPYSFMVMQSQPHRYNILFYDQARQEEIRPALTSVMEAWNRHRLDPSHITDVPKTAYASFNSTTPHVTAVTILDRLFYWEPGTYRLCMIVETEKGKSFMKHWLFMLSAEDEKNLRCNSAVLVQEVCEQENIKCNFAYPRYQDPSSKSATTMLPEQAKPS
jgi:hypothetical protein